MMPLGAWPRTSVSLTSEGLQSSPAGARAPPGSEAQHFEPQLTPTEKHLMLDTQIVNSFGLLTKRSVSKQRSTRCYIRWQNSGTEMTAKLLTYRELGKEKSIQ